MIPYPASFVVGATVQIYNFNTLPAFNRTYTITSVVLGSSLFYANYTSGLTIGDRYYTSTARAFVTNGSTGSVSCMSLSSQISASLANLTATGTNAISNLTTTGTLTTAGITATGTTTISNLSTTGSLTSAGPVICNNTTAIGYWLPSNGTTSIYITDTSANVATPATTLSRYFATGGAVYQDFYGSFNWRATTGLNSALVTTMMSLSNSTLTVSAITNITGNTTVIGTVGITGNTGVTGTFGVTGALTQTGGAQTFSLGAYGTSGDYIIPPTNIYGSTVFDGFNGVNIQNQASQYGRNILFLTGRYEASNDAWSWSAPRNAIIFRTQATLNASASIRYTIQNYFQELGIMCAGKGSVPITKWGNDGTMTHTDNINLGGSLVTTGTNPLYVANACAIWAKNSAGTNQVFLHPIYSDNVTYLNYGSAGFNIRNNAGTNTMFLNNAGNVGIGNTGPICALDCVGIANIWTGTRFAVSQGYMSAGSLTIGSISASYGGSTTGWSSNTAGLMFETNANQEICCHHSGNSVNSLLYYQGSSRRILLGRNMGGGWGENPVLCEGTIYATASTSASLRSTYGQLYISNGYNNNSIIHRHDGAHYYFLISNGVYDTSWNSLRPFYINIATGLLNSNNSQYFRGGCNIERNTPSGSHGDSALYVTADTGGSLIECRHSNGSQGVGIAYNSIYATGYNVDQDLNISARGNGALKLNQPTVTLPNITGQTSYTANILQIGSSSQICYAQLQTIRCNTRGNWGGGVSIGEFDKGSTNSAVVISGGASYYVSSGGNTEIVVRLYNSRTGSYYYFNYLQFTNVTYNHTSFPISNFAPNNTLPYGYYYIYVYLQSGSWITDGNDYCCFNVTIHP